MHRRLRSLAVALTFALAPAVVSAQNIVTNGSFETGNFAGWDVVGEPDAFFVDFGPAFIDGIFEAIAGPVGSVGTMSQTLNTTPGTQYLFSFWLDNIFTGPPSFFSVSWAGSELLALTDFEDEGYQSYSFLVDAVDAETELAFSFRHDDAFFFLDDVRATPAGVVPEPATITLLATGLAGLVAARRRTRRQR